MPRTAGDSWGIASSVGSTALFLCAARALDAALEPPLANDEYAARSFAAAGEPNPIAAVDKPPRNTVVRSGDCRRSSREPAVGN